MEELQSEMSPNGSRDLRGKSEQPIARQSLLKILSLETSTCNKGKEDARLVSLGGLD